MPRRKPRSPGVSLRGRSYGPDRFASEMSVDGGKRKIRRQVRLAIRLETRRIAADETSE